MFDWLFGSSEKKSTSKVEIPKWVEDAGKQNYNFAQNITGQPYQPYGGDRVADLTDRQMGSFDMLDQFMPSLLAGGKSGIDMSRMGEFMDPYVNDVVDATTADMVRGSQMQGETLDNAFHSGGAFGDARQGAYDAEMGKNLASEVGRMSAGLRSGGFAQALEALMREPSIEGQQMGNALNYVGAQQGAGAIEQGQNQSEQDWLYQLFNMPRDRQIEDLNVRTSALSGTPYSKTQVNTEQGPSMFAQLLGGLSSAAGAYYGA